MVVSVSQPVMDFMVDQRNKQAQILADATNEVTTAQAKKNTAQRIVNDANAIIADLQVVP